MKIKDLEEEKLELEIQDLKRHWIKKPQYLQVLLPTTLAIFSLLYAITTGLFSSKQELLELNKKRLETDILTFQKEKSTLIETNILLKKNMKLYNDSLKNKNLILKKYENSFIKERRKIEILKEELTSLQNTRQDYYVEIKKLEFEFELKKKKYLNEIESKYYKEIDNDKRIKELKSINNQLKDQIRDLNQNIKILKSNPFIQKNKEHDFNMWVSNKMIDFYESKGKSNDENIKKSEKNIEKFEKKTDSLKVKLKILEIK